MRTALLDAPTLPRSAEPARDEPLRAEPRSEPRAEPRRGELAGRQAASPAVPHGSSAPTRTTYWRRRAVVVAALLGLAFLVTGLIGRIGAEAELDDPVAGHEVVEPGETLWDVAAATAPDGVDPREHLAAIEELNGLEEGPVDPWTVVLIPAR